MPPDSALPRDHRPDRIGRNIGIESGNGVVALDSIHCTPLEYPAHRSTQGKPVKARGEGRELTARDREIAAAVGPTLRDKGVIFAGLDVIGDFLTEINVTSPTAIRELDRAFDLTISDGLLDAIDRRLQHS